MNRRGLTLIELTVSMGIVAVLVGGVVMGMGALTGSTAKAAASELAGTIRSLYDSANLQGKTCRLVFELPNEKDGGKVKYRAECAQGGLTAAKDRTDTLRRDTEEAKKPKRPKDDRFRRLDSDDAPSVQELQEREKERVESAAKFSGFTSEEVPERVLPSNVRVSVWTKHQREATKSGLAYLYFFPQGFTERAQIWVSQGDNTWTLSVSPLTGKVSSVAEELEVPRS